MCSSTKTTEHRTHTPPTPYTQPRADQVVPRTPKNTNQKLAHTTAAARFVLTLDDVTRSRQQWQQSNIAQSGSRGQSGAHA